MGQNYLTVYHGTSSKKLDQIKSQGIKSPMEHDARWYMVSTDFDDAASFAYSDPIVIEIRIPIETNAKWEGYPYLWPKNNSKSSAYNGDFYAIRKTIPTIFMKTTTQNIKESTYMDKILKKKENLREAGGGGLSDGMTVQDIVDKHNADYNQIVDQLMMGKDVEMEHTNNEKLSLKIAKDHLVEDPEYYTKLKNMEDNM